MERFPARFIDEAGRDVDLPLDYVEWFENVEYLPGGMISAEAGEGFFIISVDGEEYRFGFHVGSQLAVQKTATGFILLPEETVALAPPPE